MNVTPFHRLLLCGSGKSSFNIVCKGYQVEVNGIKHFNPPSVLGSETADHLFFSVDAARFAAASTSFGMACLAWWQIADFRKSRVNAVSGIAYRGQRKSLARIAYPRGE